MSQIWNSYGFVHLFFSFFCARLPAHFNISGYDSAPEYHSIIRTQPKWLINECEDALQREHLTRDFCSQRDLMLQLSFELWLHLVSWILTRNFYGLKLFPRNSRATCWRQNSPTQTALLLPIASRCSPELWPVVCNGACGVETGLVADPFFTFYFLFFLRHSRP